MRTDFGQSLVLQLFPLHFRYMWYMIMGAYRPRLVIPAIMNAQTSIYQRWIVSFAAAVIGDLQSLSRRKPSLLFLDFLSEFT